MAHSNTSTKENTEIRTIYILMKPRSKAFFISHCHKKQLKSVFQDHYYGERYQTQEVFGALKEQNLHPCLFTLEEVVCTEKEAYHYVVAWTKIFCDAGYYNLNQGNVSEHIDNMIDATREIYKHKTAINISELVTCSKCLVANYAKKKCLLFSGEESCFVWEHDEEHTLQVKTRVSSAEKKQIEKNAEACGMSQSAYLRTVALDMVVITVDDSFSQVRADAIRQASEAISQLVYHIKRNDQFVPEDLEYIYKKTKDMVNIQKNILREQREHFDIIMKNISNTVQDAVEKKLKQKEHLL